MVRNTKKCAVCVTILWGYYKIGGLLNSFFGLHFVNFPLLNLKILAKKVDNCHFAEKNTYKKVQKSEIAKLKK